MRVAMSAVGTRYADTLAALGESGYARFTAGDTQDLAALGGARAEPLKTLDAFWNSLPPDPHLKDGGRYRFRRHASYVQAFPEGKVSSHAHRAHWQPVDYNALHGGIERWFDPVLPEMASKHPWNGLLQGCGQLFHAAAAARGMAVAQWFIEAHPFRIDTKDGVGRPTPEGAHRDGVDYVVVVLVQRHAVKGGETRVFEADGPTGVRFTMQEPWSALLLDDAKVIHETTPIQPLREQPGGVRDTLVLTYRANGFQDPV
jgi:hypothetical protein